jgi:predicted hydrolase (HD superfamily)
MTPFQKQCELEALVTEREAIAVLHRHNPTESTHEQMLSLAASMRALVEHGSERLPDWAKPLMRHVRNFCTTHQGAENPDLLRMLHAWEALTDEQRNEVQP